MGQNPCRRRGCQGKCKAKNSEYTFLTRAAGLRRRHPRFPNVSGRNVRSGRAGKMMALYFVHI